MMVELLNEMIGTKVKPQYAEPRVGDVKHSLANIGKAQQFLDYKASFDFSQGLKKLVESSGNLESPD